MLKKHNENKKCFFCGERARTEKIILKGPEILVRLDDHGVSPLHALFFSARHVECVLDLFPKEVIALWKNIELFWKQMQSLPKERRPDGLNYGNNYGLPAGQGHGHIHGHGIERYRGDASYNVLGGICWVVPSRAKTRAEVIASASRELVLAQKIIAQNKLWMAISDLSPVNPGHVRFILKKGHLSVMKLSAEEVLALFSLVKIVWGIIQEKHRSDGFNFGFNHGQAAGQDDISPDIHLIPRYIGDVPHDPQGGVRWVIPEKAPESKQSRPPETR